MIKIKNEKGLTTGVTSFKTNVSKHLIRYNVEKFNRKNIVVNVRNIGGFHWYYTIKNLHNMHIKVKIHEADYTGVYDGKSNIISPSFKGSEEYHIGPNDEINFINSYPYKEYSARLTFGINFLNEYIEIDNISSFKSSYGNRISKDTKPIITVINDVNLKNFNIRLHKNTYMKNTNLIKFMRRNVTLSENSKFEDLYDFDDNNFRSFSKDYSVIDDYQLEIGHTYEYIAVILQENGSIVYSEKFRETYHEASNFVNCSLDIKEGVGKLLIKKIDKRSNTLNALIEVLKELGDEKFFDEDLKLINQTSQELLFAKVLILEESDRGLHYKNIGEFKDGDLITLPPINRLSSRSYDPLIKILPYQNSPLLIINQINTLVSKIDDAIASTQSNAVEKSVLLVKAKRKLDTFNADRDKFLTNDYLLKGRLPADNQSPDFLNEFQNIKEKNPIYDIATLLFANKTLNMDCNVKKMSYYSLTDRRIVLKFKLDVTSDMENFVDFYIITCKKEGSSYPVTSVNGNKSEYTIIDNTNKNYMGQIKYLITPVMRDGVFKTSTIIGTINYFDHRKI